MFVFKNSSRQRGKEQQETILTKNNKQIITNEEKQFCVSTYMF